MMRFLRLEIAGFGALRDCVVDFGPGVTVLLGPNETGKSTALQCLAHVLMGRPSQRSLFADMKPWDGGPFGAALVFERGEERYRLTRRFDESGGRAIALRRLGANGAEATVSHEAGEVRKWVAEAFGTADDRIFYRVFCLNQADLNPLDGYAGLREHLERVTAGAEVTVTAALGRVDERLASLRRGVGQPALEQNWGALKRAEHARRDWEARQVDAQRQQRRLAEVRAAAEAQTVEIVRGTARQEEIVTLLAQERLRRDLQGRQTELQSAWGALDGERERVDRLRAERDRAEQALAGLPAACADVGALRSRLAELGQGGEPISAWGMLLGGLLGTGLVYLLTWQAWSLVVALAAIAVAVPRLLAGRRRAQTAAALCKLVGVPSLAEVTQRLEDAERYQLERDAAALALQAVTDPAALQVRQKELAREMAMVEERLAQIPGRLLTAEEAHRLTREQERLSDLLPAWREQERKLMREVAVLEEAERDLTDLEDGVAYWRAEEARAREEEQTLLLARELLVAAGERAHGELADPLASRIAPLFSAMTGGRYPEVAVAGEARALLVHPCDAQGMPVPPEQLSRGTRDQFLLAVRLGLGQVVAGPGAAPAFLLDDPLLHFDEARRREALSVLTQLSRSSQVILATHDETVLADLPGATVVRLAGASPAARR